MAEEISGTHDILFLGRITEEKGILTLLDAWQIVESRTSLGHLKIAGDGPLSAEVERRCASLKRAEYLGFTKGDAKRDLLASCRALAVPSIWWEPLGLVLYEAYEHAKPVIAARTGGIVDHVTDRVTGWLHEPGDVGELSRHILDAIENPSKCQSLGKAGKQLLTARQADDWLERFTSFAEATIQRKQAETRKEEVTGWNAGGRGQETEVRSRRSKVEGRRSNPSDSSLLSPPITSNQSPITLSIYLADQNPMLGRSLGISRMTVVVIGELRRRPVLRLHGTASKSSISTGIGTDCLVLPWKTKTAFTRVLTDHLHPLMQLRAQPDVWYYPKGFLPILHNICSPSVVTIHDTIVQYYADHYPDWRHQVEYGYWSHLLQHTLMNADYILTVSHTSKRHIREFMKRNRIEEKEIFVTYEPCLYEQIDQPTNPLKGDYVLHLGSREPHKRTAWLIEFWLHPDHNDLPKMHLVGSVPEKMEKQVSQSDRIVKLPFLDDAELQTQFSRARALIFPSEIEGFGLPAIEAYYLGTPACFVKGTSVEEVLEVATHKGGFHLDDPESLRHALDAVLAMPDDEIRRCGLKLRETYAAAKVVDRMTEVFLKAAVESR